MSSTYIVIYPAGDRSRLSIAEIWDGLEIDQYDLASRHKFRDEDEARKYCIDLAKQHGLQTDMDGPAYLD